MKKLCIYHGNCADGFGAAWVVRKALGDDVEFYPGVYQEAPPDVTGRDVILVDFSYKRPVLMEMAKDANTILVLDHHKSAAEDLAGFPERVEIPGEKIVAIFDMDRSGAMMAWDFFFPDQEPPALIQHIQDRDLWRFNLEGTREIQACVFSYPYDFDVWDSLFAADLEDLRREGAAIERKHFKDIAELIPATKRRMEIGGFDVPVANLPYIHSSDAGHQMAVGEPFAACYMDGPNGRTFSLRSADDGEDVSAIAAQYGGGGHAQAAGFMVSPEHELANT